MPATTDGEEVEWLKEQFNPAQHVPKGTWVKMQIARGNRERGAACLCTSYNETA